MHHEAGKGTGSQVQPFNVLYIYICNFHMFELAMQVKAH